MPRTKHARVEVAPTKEARRRPGVYRPSRATGVLTHTTHVRKRHNDSRRSCKQEERGRGGIGNTDGPGVLRGGSTDAGVREPAARSRRHERVRRRWSRLEAAQVGEDTPPGSFDHQERSLLPHQTTGRYTYKAKGTSSTSFDGEPHMPCIPGCLWREGLQYVLSPAIDELCLVQRSEPQYFDP